MVRVNTKHSALTLFVRGIFKNENMQVCVCVMIVCVSTNVMGILQISCSECDLLRVARVFAVNQFEHLGIHGTHF